MIKPNASPNSGTQRLWPTAILLLAAVILSLTGRLTPYEDRLYDLFLTSQYKTASDKIALITVNTAQDKNDELWTEAQFFKLAEKLNEAGAELIVATQPVRLPKVADEQQIAALEELARRTQKAQQRSGSNAVDEDVAALNMQLENFKTQYQNRLQLAEKIAAAGNIIFASVATNYLPASEDTGSDCAEHTAILNDLASNELRRVRKSEVMITPPKNICAAGRSMGFINYWPEPDERLRHSELLLNVKGNYYPSIAMAAFAASDENKPDRIVVASPTRLAAGDRSITTDAGMKILTRYYPEQTDTTLFDVVGFQNVLDGNFDAELIRDRIVLIGKTGSRDDSFITTTSYSMPSLYVEATTLSNLLQNDFLRRPDWIPYLEYGLLIAIALIVLLWVPSMPAIGAWLLGFILATLLLILEAYFLITSQIWVRLVTAAGFAAVAVWTVHLWLSILGAIYRHRTKGLSQDLEHSHFSDKDELDLQFSVLRQQSPTSDIKEKMYEIAMTYGRGREFAKAERVLIHLSSLDPNYRDVADRLRKLSGARKLKSAQAKQASKGKKVAAGTDREKLGRYEIEGILGHGAMATVYLGRDPSINRQVAIKTIALADEFDKDVLDNARRQFKREAESAGRLNHPNIIAIYDVGEDGNVSYLAMEYFKGVSLLEHADPDTLLAPKWVLELMARTAEALDYAHSQNVVHRDVKPANLLYDSATDALKITDFGIARLTDTSRTKTGIILGTPSYMSPEQLSVSGVTGRSDIYSLGITMYQLLTGSPPFRADSIPELMDKIIHDEHTPVSKIIPNIPICVDGIINQMLAKDPADRIPNGRALALALRDCMNTFDGGKS